MFVDPNKRVLVLNINSALRCGELNRTMLLDVRKYAEKEPTPQSQPTLSSNWMIAKSHLENI